MFRSVQILILSAFLVVALTASPWNTAVAQTDGWAQVRVTNQRVGLQVQQYLAQWSGFSWSAGGLFEYQYQDSELDLKLFTLATIFFTDQSWGLELSIDDQLQWEFGVRVGVFW